MNKDLIQFFWDKAKILFLKHIDQLVFYRIKEEIDLNLALKFLKSPFLEKKLKGLNEINEISEKVDN